MAKTKPPIAVFVGRTGRLKAISYELKGSAEPLISLEQIDEEISEEIAEAEALAMCSSLPGQEELTEAVDAANWIALKSEAERVSGVIDQTVDHVRLRLATTDA